MTVSAIITWLETGNSQNPIEGLIRVGSAAKTDPLHAFPDIVDDFAAGSTEFTLASGAKLYQLEGSWEGKDGIFEWIVENGQLTHRVFIPGATITGQPNTWP